MEEKLMSLLGTVVNVYIEDETGILATVRGQLGPGFAIHVRANSNDYASIYFLAHDVAQIDGHEIRIRK